MTRTVLVLAAGEAKRWGNHRWPVTCPKQLLDVGGELLIQRTIRQVKQRGQRPILVTHNPDIARAVHDVKIIFPVNHRWAMETLWNTQHVWSGMVTYLYADVLFSARVMDALLTDERSPMLYGRKGEIYGGVFQAGDARMKDGLRAVLDHALAAPEGDDNIGRSWQLYRWLMGQDLQVHTEPLGNNEVYEFIPDEDYTRDIDIQSDWAATQNDIIKVGRLDDLPSRTMEVTA